MSTPTTSVPATLDLPPFGSFRIALGRARYWWYKLFLQKRHEGFVLEEVCGAPVIVSPGVLNPCLMRTGEFLATQLEAQLRGREAAVLDMGTGSGVCAVIAARHAARVVAIDINAAAVRCARVNVLLNRVENQVEVLEGDLFAPVAARRFDVVLFNPPFLQGVPRDDADRAWRSTDIAERFAEHLHEHLAPAGFALVLLSSFGGAAEFIRQLQRRDFDLTVAAEREFVNEKLVLFKVIPR
jgi:release factor glutamine methyltransferase